MFCLSLLQCQGEVEGGAGYGVEGQAGGEGGLMTGMEGGAQGGDIQPLPPQVRELRLRKYASFRYYY